MAAMHPIWFNENRHPGIYYADGSANSALIGYQWQMVNITIKITTCQSPTASRKKSQKNSDGKQPQEIAIKTPMLVARASLARVACGRTPRPPE
jgi:hypothetical protein